MPSDRFAAKSMQLPTSDDIYQQAEALIVEAHCRKLRLERRQETERSRAKAPLTAIFAVRPLRPLRNLP
jgi:hypothetical protein